MRKTKLIPHDTAEHLTTPRKRALYLEAMIEESNGDPTAILFALNAIARSEGMSKVSRKTGLSRENLYRALSGKKSPAFVTVLKVLAAVGLRFSATVRTT